MPEQSTVETTSDQRDERPNDGNKSEMKHCGNIELNHVDCLRRDQKNLISLTGILKEEIDLRLVRFGLISNQWELKNRRILDDRHDLDL